jgi:hypothetical protein
MNEENEDMGVGFDGRINDLKGRLRSLVETELPDMDDDARNAIVDVMGAAYSEGLGGGFMVGTIMAALAVNSSAVLQTRLKENTVEHALRMDDDDDDVSSKATAAYLQGTAGVLLEHFGADGADGGVFQQACEAALDLACSREQTMERLTRTLRGL